MSAQKRHGALSLAPSYYDALRSLTLELAGINLGANHAFLVETRLSRLARDEGYESLDDMINELFNTGGSRLAVQVVSALTERDTHFYKDKPAFKRTPAKLWTARDLAAIRILMSSAACPSKI